MKNIHIIGGGPAGLSAAYYLTKKGFKPVVYEQSNYKTREKVCGDGLTPRAVVELEEIGIDIHNRKYFMKNNGLIINRGHKYKEITVNWSDFKDFPPFGLSCKRAHLDKLLFEKAKSAGAKIIQNHKVLSLEDFPKDDIVLIATGANNNLLKRIKFEKKIEGVAVRAYFKADIDRPNYIRTYLPPDGRYGGYAWVFPLSGGVFNIGMGIMNGEKHKKNVNLTHMFQKWLGDNSGVIKDQLSPIKGAKLPMGIRFPLRHGNVFLLGDSAGLISPFNGEGVSYALDSGKIIAECIHNGKLDDYEKIIREKYSGYFGMGVPFVKIINNEKLMKFCVKHGLRTKFSQKWTSKVLSHLYTKESAGILKFFEFLFKRN